MSVREYLFLKSTEYHFLKERLSTKYSTWIDEWFTKEQTKKNIQCNFHKRDYELVGNIKEYCFGQKHSVQIRLLISDHDNSGMKHLLRQCDNYLDVKDCDLIDYLTKQSLTQLANSIVDGKDECQLLKVNSMEGADLQKHQGEIVGVCNIGKMVFYLQISTDAIKHMVNRKVELEDVDDLVEAYESIGPETLPVTITLGTTIVKLSELKQLNIGDVIVMDKKLNDPTKVNIGSSTEPLSGYLMRSKGKRAVQFI